jgi:FAD/FMN-containing dehydrogenase
MHALSRGLADDQQPRAGARAQYRVLAQRQMFRAETAGADLAQRVLEFAAHGGSSLPGLRMPSGSNTDFNCRINAKVGAIAAQAALPSVCFGHAGNGNLHVNILFDPADASQQARADAALAQVFDVVIALEGQLSGEHGIGLAKRGFMAKAIDAPTLELMRGFKRLFDPDGILNPGKVLP